MFQQIGLPEVLIVLAIVLVIFGPKRLPQLGRSLGSGMREFKDSITGRHKDEDDDQPELTTASAQAAGAADAEPKPARPAAPPADEVVSSDRRA